jgi:GNAT superfamily N-acetyltransferase
MLDFVESRELAEFERVAASLADVFGDAPLAAFRIWCDPVAVEDYTYWKIWLLRYKGEFVGVCGLYSLREHDTSELWLGWFGLAPKFRGLSLGKTALDFMVAHAIGVGCHTLYSYVEGKGGPLPFYFRNGFERIGTVEDYLDANPDIKREEFGELSDHVIRRRLPVQTV